ncbi:MAG: hypothetical protein QNK05_22955 [Myxococcota bacterium]|nr:hypothetical protein [Myxococcota bacterium]
MSLALDQRDASQRVFRSTGLLFARETWWYDASEWTERLRSSVAAELSSRGIRVADDAEVEVGLKLVRFGSLESPRDIECVARWRVAEGASREVRDVGRIPAAAWDPFTPLFNEMLERVAEEIALGIQKELTP